MSRYIHISDTKGRDAEVVFTSKTKKPKVKLVTSKGEDVTTVRVLKGGVQNSFEGMTKVHGDGHVKWRSGN